MTFDWKAFIGPIIVMLLLDFRAYRKAKKANPAVRFDWELFAERATIALLASFGLGTDLLSSVPVDVAGIVS